MNTKLFACLLASFVLPACVSAEPADESADDHADEESVGEDSQALGGQEHVFNKYLTVPAGQSESAYLTPVFHDGDSSPFDLSLPYTVLHWHASFSTVGNQPNPGDQSAYFRFMRDAPNTFDALLMSISPGGNTTSLTQFFSSYPGGTPVIGTSTIAARVLLLSGDVSLDLVDPNGTTKCSIQSGASTPRGTWTTLTKICPAPAPGQTHNGVVLHNVDDRGVAVMIDQVSVVEH